YTPFQFAFMKHQFPYTNMTLLGDTNQAIYTKAIQGSPLVPASADEAYERIVLTKSYRSTRQIVSFTSHFAPDGDIIEPFNRDGNKPQLVNHQGNVERALTSAVKELQDHGQET